MKNDIKFIEYEGVEYLCIPMDTEVIGNKILVKFDYNKKYIQTKMQEKLNS